MLKKNAGRNASFTPVQKYQSAKDIRAPKNNFPYAKPTYFYTVVSLLKFLRSYSIYNCLWTSIFSLRVSEFTTSSKNTVVLQKSDVQLSATDLRVIIKRSKNDQLGKGSTIQIPLSSQTSTLFAHLNQYLTLRPDSPVPWPFFCHLNSKSLTSYQFTYVLHKTIKFIGFWHYNFQISLISNRWGNTYFSLRFHWGRN